MEYYIIDEKNQQIGPFTIEQLRTKGINKKTKVWCEGMGDWSEAQFVPELKENINLPPAPPISQNQVYSENNQFATNSNQMLPLINPLIYHPSFNINSFSGTLVQSCKKHFFAAPFSTGLGIFLHFITLGIFTFIHCGLMHSKLPKISIKDFSTGKAIGFLFIPFFNIGWLFVFWEQLARRINFQFKLRNKPKPVSVALADWTCILSLIPYVNFVAFLILYPILYSQIRSACNKLAVESFNQ